MYQRTYAVGCARVRRVGRQTSQFGRLTVGNQRKTRPINVFKIPRTDTQHLARVTALSYGPLSGTIVSGAETRQEESRLNAIRQNVEWKCIYIGI